MAKLFAHVTDQIGSDLPLDHYMGYKAKFEASSDPKGKFFKFGPIVLDTQFGEAKYEVVKPKALLLPADKNGEGITDDVTHLEQYQIKRLPKLSNGGKQPKFEKRRNVQITNQCNDLFLELIKEEMLLVPTNKDLLGPADPVDPNHHTDHFLCYKAKVQAKLDDGTKLAKFPKGIQVVVEDQFQTRRYDLKKITRLCAPTDKEEDPGDPSVLLAGPNKGDPRPITPSTIENKDAHLVCYQAKVAKKEILQDGCGCDTTLDPKCTGTKIDPKQPKHQPQTGFLNNQFGEETFEKTKEFEFCIPSVKTFCEGEEFNSTWEAIQSIIFDSPVYGCTNGICHGSSPGQGFLDLRDPNAFANLVGVDSVGHPPFKLVEPGEPELSYLYRKLEWATLGNPAPGAGGPMPSGGAPPLTEDHLEAMNLWIRGGAPLDLVVPDTEDLLGGCLGDVDPLKTVPPDPPGLGVGLQFQQTPWDLPAQSEDEICMATYYDLTQTNLVPEWAKVPCPNDLKPPKNPQNPSGECFAFNVMKLVQDFQSHHSIIRTYIGAFDDTDPGWGGWTYKFEDGSNPLNGQVCDPTAIDPNWGFNFGCSSAVVSQVACLGFGPADLSQGAFDPNSTFGSSTQAPEITLSQEPFLLEQYPAGVYRPTPMAGFWVWNSHAFNLTTQNTTMAQFLNLTFADANSQDHELIDLFEAGSIFVPNVPAFQTREYCRTYTPTQGTEIFEVASHTHQRGVRFRIWPPPNTPCLPHQPACVSRLDAPLYESLEYTDPLQMIFDPPRSHPHADDPNRTYLYCSIYDNGSTLTSPPVKRRSTSPVPPTVFGLPLGPGGPCSDATVVCLGGPNKGQNCNGNDGQCPGSVCDACPVLGGVTTEDEMFILLGNEFKP